MKQHMDQPNDRELAELLQCWKAVEPKDTLEDEVLRRICSEQRTAESSALCLFIESFLPQPGWMTALAASVAIILGIWAGISIPVTGGDNPDATPLLQPNSLAHSYLSLLTGGVQ
jgi:hypothetical protein